MPRKQKFHAGDIVEIRKDSCFVFQDMTEPILARVIGSYHDQYGGTGADTRTSYSVSVINPIPGSKGPMGHLSWVKQEDMKMRLGRDQH